MVFNVRVGVLMRRVDRCAVIATNPPSTWQLRALYLTGLAESGAHVSAARSLLYEEYSRPIRSLRKLMDDACGPWLVTG